MISPAEDFFRRMKAVYDAMDRAYGSAAEHYGFSCEGCEDNCCTQRFYHHTLAEYYYLFEGLMQAERELIRQMLVKARIVADSYQREIQAGRILPLMCPANFEGLCRLYEHRPMICRMHGLPHRFIRPDGREERGTGCKRFEETRKADFLVDRTALYTALAEVEKEIRARTLFRGRYSKTTAEMLLDMLDEEPSLQEIMSSED